jgi:hypothetical protein
MPADLGDTFKELVFDAVVKAGIARLFTALPFLGWGPIGIIVSWALTLLADRLYEALSLAIEMEKISIRNEQSRKAYDRALVVLRIVAREKGLESEEFRRSKNEAKEALSRLVRMAS